MNEEKLKIYWGNRGFSYGVMVDVPGQRWEDFKHDVNELVAVLSGEITVIVENETSVLSVGDEVFIPANAVHSVINSGNSDAVWAFGYQDK